MSPRRALSQKLEAEALHSAAEVWSCTIFHPSWNLLNTRVNNPCG
ncbi:MAG: hypothetical protein QOF94_2093, partial [Acidobacteriaceae bacterium]